MSDFTVQNDYVVEFNYTLKDDDGEVIDSSEGHGPLPYIHGKANIVAGLEKELTGKKVGDKLNVVVSPEEGYGKRQADLVQSVPLSAFDEANEVKVGAQFHVQTEAGHPLLVTVIEVNENDVVLDGNHPLADVSLHFDVEIVNIRKATEQELSHGHIHAPGESCGD